MCVIKFQSSRELLQTFSCKYLGGEGDIIRHLAHFGYAVTHTQVCVITLYIIIHTTCFISLITLFLKINFITQII